MPLIAPHTCRYEAKGFDCSYGGPLTILSLANFLQETAGDHAARIGYGVESLQGRGLTWMLSRLDLRADALPREPGPIDVTTWPSGMEKLFALRDFHARGSDGRSLARAIYAYLVVDMEARRPLRPERFFGGDPPLASERHSVDPHGFRVPEAGSTTVSFAQRAMSRHIDNNGHVNNAHLIDWLVDAAPRGERRSPDGGPGTLAALRVEFLSEALEGEELEVAWGRPADLPEAWPSATGSIVAELRRAEGRTGGAVARALVAWR